jgi:hypothetical protein
LGFFYQVENFMQYNMKSSHATMHVKTQKERQQFQNGDQMLLCQLELLRKNKKKYRIVLNLPCYFTFTFITNRMLSIGNAISNRIYRVFVYSTIKGYHLIIIIIVFLNV